MKFKNMALVGLVAVAAAGTAGWLSLDKETRGFLAAFPTNRDLLFWSTSQRDAAFRALDRLPFLAKHRVVPAGTTPSPLPPGPPLALPLDVDAYMQGQRSAALMVLHNGQVRLERYGLDFDSQGRWTSFSVAKSFTSTLVGRGRARRPHQEHGRQGQRLHRRNEGLGLRRRQHPPAAHHDIGRGLERRLRRPELGRGPVQQPPARRRCGRRGELPAQAAARRAGRHPLALQHRRNQSGGRAGVAGHPETLVELFVRKNLGAHWHGAASHLDSQQNRARNQRLLLASRHARLCPLRAVHLEWCGGQRPAHRARRLAARSHHRPHRHRPARARLWLPVVLWTRRASW